MPSPSGLPRCRLKNRKDKEETPMANTVRKNCASIATSTGRRAGHSLFQLTVAIVLAISLLRTDSASAQFWKASGQNIVDENGKNVLLHGFGPGEWLNTEAYMIEWPDCDPGASGKGCNSHNDSLYGATEIQTVLITLMGSSSAAQFQQTWRANDITEVDFARMQAWGGNSLRLSVNYHWLSPSDGTYLDSGWAYIDNAIAWGKAHNIRIVLCLHAAPGSQSNYLMADTPDPGLGIEPAVAHLWDASGTSTYQPWTVHLWTAIAQRYANEPYVLGYDLLDEPIPPSTSQVRPFYVTLTNAIRTVDTNHIIFAEGANFADPSSPANFDVIMPPFDSNMVVVFHKYWDKNDQASIQGPLNIRSTYNVPLWNGETGEPQRSSWISGMVTLMANNNIGWNWWTYKKVNSIGSVAYSITAPSNYSAILNYVNCWWPGNTSCTAPSQSTAQTVELALAANDATSKCTFDSATVNVLFPASKLTFAISVTPLTQTVTHGSQTTYALALFPYGMSGNATLTVSGLPSGATGTFSPSSPSVSGTSTLTVSTASTTPAGTYNLVVSGKSGSVTQTVNLVLVVN
jgi:endoglucanase